MPPPALPRSRRPVADYRGALARAGARRSAGCSLLKLGYGQAQPLAFRWLDGYVEFDDAQSRRVHRPRSTRRWPGTGAASCPTTSSCSCAPRARWSARRRRSGCAPGRASCAAALDPVLQHVAPTVAEVAADADAGADRAHREALRRDQRRVARRAPAARSAQRRSAPPSRREVERAETLYGRLDDGAARARRRARSPPRRTTPELQLRRTAAAPAGSAGAAARACARRCRRAMTPRPGARLPAAPSTARRARPTGATPTGCGHNCALRERAAQQRRARRSGAPRRAS